MLVGARLDELRGDAHAAARPLHRTLDDGVYVEFPRDLRQWLVRAFVAHHRRP
jgi:hypothetical protein